MDTDPPTCSEDDTLETVATVMHERNVSRLPVIRDGKLVGIIARGDVVRSLVADSGSPGQEAPPSETGGDAPSQG
jgi:CBS domain-containing protein